MLRGGRPLFSLAGRRDQSRQVSEWRLHTPGPPQSKVQFIRLEKSILFYLIIIFKCEIVTKMWVVIKNLSNRSFCVEFHDRNIP